jgi:hypothetical protein
MLSQGTVSHTIPFCYLLLLGGLACFGCAPRAPARPAAAPRPSASPTPFPVTAELSKANTVFSNKAGQRLLELRGVRGALLPSGKEATLEGTQAVVYEKGKPTLTVSARHVRVLGEANTLVAEGSVSATTPDGRVVRADTLTWLPGKNIAKEPGRVEGRGNVSVVSGQDFALYGSRFTADTLLKTLKLLP